MLPFLLLVVVAIGLGVVGALTKGAIYLVIIGIAVFLIDFVFFGAALGRPRAKPRHRSSARP